MPESEAISRGGGVALQEALVRLGDLHAIESLAVRLHPNTSHFIRGPTWLLLDCLDRVDCVFKSTVESSGIGLVSRTSNYVHEGAYNVISQIIFAAIRVSPGGNVMGRGLGR